MRYLLIGWVFFVRKSVFLSNSEKRFVTKNKKLLEILKAGFLE